MKVLHVLNELNPSGAETMLYAIGPLLKKNGITGEILSTGCQPGPYTGQLKKVGYKIHHASFKKSPLFFLRILKFLHDNRYDVIHLHTERANFWFGIISLLTAKRTVRTIHSTFPFEGLLGWTRKWQRQILDRLGLTHIAISQSVQNTEIKHYQLKPLIIQNWYNSHRFKLTLPTQRSQARTDLGLTGGNVVLLTVGNCSPVKNHVELIHALAITKKKNWIYLHIGIEKDETERDLTLKLGIADRVRFLGMQNDILPFLQAADLFVMPSTHEGCSIASIEAMATGLPVLLANVPGLIDFKNIFNNLLYCNPDAGSIAAALSNFFSTNIEQQRQYFSESPQVALRHFGAERGLSDYICVYKNKP